MSPSVADLKNVRMVWRSFRVGQLLVIGGNLCAVTCHIRHSLCAALSLR